jgi:hypothetical protein
VSSPISILPCGAAARYAWSITRPPNETMATAATALKVFRVLCATIVNMTLSLLVSDSTGFFAGPDVLMCSSGVVVNYNTDSNASTF